MKVLVTGGAGFIGSNFVELALSDQFPKIASVIVLDKLTYAGRLSNLDSVIENDNFEFVMGDICDPDTVNNLASQVDAIINFAAESHLVYGSGNRNVLVDPQKPYLPSMGSSEVVDRIHPKSLPK